MRTEIKDVDPRDAAAFMQDIIDYLEINESQVADLNQVMRTHGLRAEIWVDECGCYNASPDLKVIGDAKTEDAIDSAWGDIVADERYEMCRDSFSIGFRMGVNSILENSQDQARR